MIKRSKKSPKKQPVSPGVFASPDNMRVADFTRELKSIDDRITQVSQWAVYGFVTSTTVATGLYAFSTVFTDLPDNANYSAAFDQYRIDCVEYHVIPVTQPSLPASSIGYSFAHVYHDYDDAATPSGTTAALSTANMTVLGPGDKHIRKIKPHVAIAASSSGAAAITGVRNEQAGWFDAASSNVPHYGLKIVVSQSTSTSANAWYVYARITASLRNVR
jgi:hypothetical protein